MSYGEQFLTILTKALKLEETELRRMTVSPKSNKSLTSVHQYAESWLAFVFVKQAIRDKFPLLVGVEKNKVDLTFYDGETPTASFEFKRWQDPLKENHKRLVVKDIGRQFRAGREDKLEHYVVLLLTAKKMDNIKRFVGELEQNARDEFHGVLLEKISSRRPLKLNDGQILMSTIFHVAKTKGTAETS